MTPLTSSTKSVLSERLQELLIDIIDGKAPNAGQFCGYCYSPSTPKSNICDHCGRSQKSWPRSKRIPDEVIWMFRTQRSREGRVVRTVAYGGLLIGITVAILPISFFDVQWWTATALFGIIIFSYFFFANLANTVGDTIGYRWGQRTLTKNWEVFVGTRDSDISQYNK